MIIVVFVIAFLLGAAAGAVLLWRLLPARFRQHVDYKERWEAAIGLLGTQGQLTAGQFSMLMGGIPVKPASSPESPLVAAAATLRAIHEMASWDRRDLEISRAKRGLPPVDDLADMASWDQKAVLAARAKAGTG